jgi:hypothetical protein
MVYYNTGYPLGTLNFWPVPSQGVEFHLWSDQVFTSLNLADPLSMPRGYFMGLQYSLSEMLCAEYGMPIPPDIRRLARQFRDAIKSLNANPQAETSMDSALVNTSGSDAGFILHGGFQ